MDKAIIFFFPVQQVKKSTRLYRSPNPLTYKLHACEIHTLKPSRFRAIRDTHFHPPKLENPSYNLCLTYIGQSELKMGDPGKAFTYLLY